MNILNFRAPGGGIWEQERPWFKYVSVLIQNEVKRKLKSNTAQGNFFPA